MPPRRSATPAVDPFILALHRTPACWKWASQARQAAGQSPSNNSRAEVEVLRLADQRPGGSGNRHHCAAANGPSATQRQRHINSLDNNTRTLLPHHPGKRYTKLKTPISTASTSPRSRSNWSPAPGVIVPRKGLFAHMDLATLSADSALLLLGLPLIQAETRRPRPARHRDY